jgi:hypothetical protein
MTSVDRTPLTCNTIHMSHVMSLVRGFGLEVCGTVSDGGASLQCVGDFHVVAPGRVMMAEGNHQRIR